MLVCPTCGQENPEAARFCFACGTPFETTSPAREERKVVTVLFADLVGFTSRAEQLDPEDVRALLAPYHQRLRSELERFGGTVEKFIGDAVVALFGRRSRTRTIRNAQCAPRSQSATGSARRRNCNCASPSTRARR
jgi:class 3 adenylate cyclase